MVVILLNMLMQETWVHTWVGKIPWRKEMETHSSILARKIPWTEEPGGLQFMGLQGVRHDWVTNIHTWDGQSCRQYKFSIIIAQTRSGVRQLEWRGWL